jgi:hypothetical protein
MVFPTKGDYDQFCEAVSRLRRRQLDVNDEEFVAEIVTLDRRRFSLANDVASPEWGHPLTSTATQRFIFNDCSHALTLFILTCWYDAAEDYTTVWTTRLEHLAEWLSQSFPSRETLPSARFDDWKKASVWTTWQRCQSHQFAEWFITTVNGIADDNPGGTANLRRFARAMAVDLTAIGTSTKQGMDNLANRFVPVLYKRVWMAVMFLRRDQGIIRSLLQRDTLNIDRSSRALERWYDDRVFPPTESELPVDARMLRIGRRLFSLPAQNGQAIMQAAHDWGAKHRLAPSTIDSLFFLMDDNCAR